MFYPEDIIEEVRQRNDIVDVISSYVKLTKKGSNYMGLCPFHTEKSPSFSVSSEKQMYHCFGCGVGGNVFTFIMEYENYSFLEAVKMLADRTNMSLPEEEYKGEARKQSELRTKLLAIQKEAAKYFYYQLKSDRGKIAYQYFIKRGILKETITKFGLGYSNKYSNDLYQYLKKLGYDDTILNQSGLVTIEESKGAYDKFWNRAMFPIMDSNNRVIGFGGRVMGEGTPKYLNSPETKIFDKSRNLYGLNLARTSKRDTIILCEGYMDVIALHQAGFDNAVASLGTAFTGLQANLIKRYTKEVLLAYDSDAAGVKAALRAIPILKENGLSVKVISMKPYKDPDEFIKVFGTQEFQKRIDMAPNSFYYEIELLEQEYNLEDPEQKTKLINEVAKQLLEFEEEIERNIYIEAIAKRYYIDSINLKRLVNQYGAKMIVSANYQREKRQKIENNQDKKTEDGFEKAQKMLLTWLVSDTWLFSKIKDIIKPDDFKKELYHQVAKMLYEQFDSKQHVTPAEVINHFESKEEQREVALLFHTNLQENLSIIEKEKALNEIVKRIKIASLDYDSKRISDEKQLLNNIKQRQDLQKLHISLHDG